MWLPLKCVPEFHTTNINYITDRKHFKFFIQLFSMCIISLILCSMQRARFHSLIIIFLSFPLKTSTCFIILATVDTLIHGIITFAHNMNCVFVTGTRSSYQCITEFMATVWNLFCVIPCGTEETTATPIPLCHPNFFIPNWKKIKESYMCFVADNGSCLFNLFVILNLRKILSVIFAECELQFRQLKNKSSSMFPWLICRS